MTANRTRGQKAGLTREAILEGAVRLVDRDGLAKLSMRRLGAEVDVEAMTLYHYFAGKDALLDGLVEHVFARADFSLAGGRSWQDGLRDYARSLRATLLEHPGLVPLVVSRPAVTEQSLRIMEHGLAELHAAGFGLRAALDLVYSLNEFVLGHLVSASNPAVPDTASVQEGHLTGIDPGEYPLISEAIRADRDREADTRFDVALEAIFRGFGDLRRT
ncbi:TetR/AcrR family transcriptional regulator C-terminal domain-containing protein [Glycomyces sp. A-F 0318]|uniref:TetR/AcrR family transcriptional regulator C-terminal domain-containing protein n=1 Tax=Glycomyces amatae TaxID=2881355 RepID=UPI001E5E9C59|nr:TetR/AcrR family transcriptional regulator C-terminal domain-containing protein [Glycomyces amatae]MCD0446965.1 TetR/AcrR family transcriptional regulator C-terminal domain-containing protein [Glycomyces amatae]